ncbi:hypothetical protein ACJX0J_033005, partial [Zea mays]
RLIISKSWLYIIMFSINLCVKCFIENKPFNKNIIGLKTHYGVKRKCLKKIQLEELDGSFSLYISSFSLAISSISHALYVNTYIRLWKIDREKRRDREGKIEDVLYIYHLPILYSFSIDPFSADLSNFLIIKTAITMIFIFTTKMPKTHLDNLS